jgi:hypothetical protein
VAASRNRHSDRVGRGRNSPPSSFCRSRRGPAVARGAAELGGSPPSSDRDLMANADESILRYAIGHDTVVLVFLATTQGGHYIEPCTGSGPEFANERQFIDG